MHNTRHTIALIIDSICGIGSNFSVWHSAWQGLARAAEQRNANLIVVTGGSVDNNPNNKYEKTKNRIYDLLNGNSLDGIIIAGSSIGNYISKDELRLFAERYRPLPMVCIGGPIEGIPSILMDNYSGLKAVIKHLYEEHSYNRIAFIRGPAGNNDADVRFNVYKEMLNNFGLQYEPDLVYTGNYLEESGTEAVRSWLDEKKASFQTIVSSNDTMAIGAVKELVKRGINVPDKVAVTGFDDIEEAATFYPPLTTVRQPILKMSKRAGDLLLDFLEGKAPLLENEYLPAECIIRLSCGCRSFIMKNFDPIRFFNLKTDYKISLASERPKILAGLKEFFGGQSGFSKAEKVLDAFYSEIVDGKEGQFFSILALAINETISSGKDIAFWHDVINTLKNSILPLIGKEDEFLLADSLFQKANYYISDLSFQAVSLQKQNSEKRSYYLSILSQAISSCFERAELFENIVSGLSRLDFPSFYISLYEDGAENTDKLRIFTAYDGKKIALDGNEVSYPSSELFPQSFFPADRRYTMIAAPLYIRNENLGLIFIETGPMEGIIYETIATLVSSSLESGILIEKVESSNKTLLVQLMTDPLTNMSNRNKLMEDLALCSDPVVIIFNIDSFQEINDFYGTEVGDMILRELANRLRYLNLGISYRLYKMHADEYTILIENSGTLKDLDYWGIYLSEEVMDRPFIYKDTEIYISVSLGIGTAQNMSHGESGLEIGRNALRNADMALKRAKVSRKKYVIYQEFMEIVKEYENNIQWTKKLKSAIKDDRIVPYFQPILNNYTGKIEKYECLMRMIDENGSVIAPLNFLNTAKKARLYRYLTKIMLEKSFDFFRDNEFEFSLNLSLDDIMDEKTIGYLYDLIKNSKGASCRAVFELLETENIENYKEVTEFINYVKKCGCKIAIDDFGTGYSNFSHLIHMQIDYIKIDASLIKNINNDKISQIITRTIASFAKELGLKTISEFVHSKEVYDKCLEIGIDYSQGYYLGEPKKGLIGL